MANRDFDSGQTQHHIDLKRGGIVSHYEIAEKIGAGGMGEVYLARDIKLGRQVALKFMPTHLAGDRELRARFTREAQAAARLNHPNIVPVYEVSEFKGRPYIAMGYIEGETLREINKRGDLKLSESISIAEQICEGLQCAHEEGIVHRDIKPGNIIIDKSNRARILDFGLAIVTGEEQLTKTGSTLGTVGYMAPEQVSSAKVDKRADIFSLGVILYEMITGRRPFVGDNDAAVVKAITDVDPEPIARFKSGTTGELQQIIDKALTKDPAHRYQHADGMLADLRRLSIEKPASGQTRAPLWAAVAVVVLVAGYFFYDNFGNSDQITSTPEDTPVLIVLPFSNLGMETDEYFSDGIRDEINSRLSMIKGLRVISPRSADLYKDTEKDVGEIGLETGADYVLEATIRWDKSSDIDRIRITPRLTKTTDGYMMWGDNYEERLTEVFEVQEKIAAQIVTALGITLVETDKDAPDYAPTSNMAAYNFYLRGLDISGKTVHMTDYRTEIAMYDSAVALDPNFAMAWALKSMAHTNFYFDFTTENAAHHKTEARRAAEMALQISPDLAMGHIAMGTYLNKVEMDYEGAMTSFAAAKSEVTSNAELSEAIGVVKMRQGKFDEALDKFNEAARIDPLTVKRYYWLTTCYMLTRGFDAARENIERMLVLDPANTDAYYMREQLNLLEYGMVIDKELYSRDLPDETLVANWSTYEHSAANSLGFWRFLSEPVDPELVIPIITTLVDMRTDQGVYFHIAQIYDLANQHEIARAYYDSARAVLARVVNTENAEFHSYCEIGLAYAFLGEKERAIAAGMKGKEMMSVDDCHW